MTIKAWMKRGNALVLTDIDEPRQASDELLVRVRAVSLNRGEVRGVALAAEGQIPGWDIAGVVERGAPDGTGPAPGTHVAALMTRGGWAEVVRVPVSRAGVVPDGLDLGVAATLPIAGLTAMRAFGIAGSLLGKEILITGGSGGVGQLAIQLGAMSGANVTAITSKKEAAEKLRTLGASNVVAWFRRRPGSTISSSNRSAGAR